MHDYLSSDRRVRLAHATPYLYSRPASKAVWKPGTVGVLKKGSMLYDRPVLGRVLSLYG